MNLSRSVVMPIYEFICQSCGNEFEHIQSFSDTSVPACAKCGSAQVVRRMGRPAIHFKGSGWYITDSKKSSNPASSPASEGKSGEGKAGEGKAADGESKSDTAPANAESVGAPLNSPAAKSETKATAAD
jgi:putative FmdB family regulatory protein